MNDSNYYSIRMHASCRGRHVSGAERIVLREKVDMTVSELISRSAGRDIKPDRISITIDDLGRTLPRGLKALDVITVEAFDYSEGRSVASQILHDAAVSEMAIRQAMNFLVKGSSPSGENMRGAMIMDALTGERLEPDRERGIRASRFDWTEEANTMIRKQLADNALSHFRTYEALALATKIAHGPGVVAELCWSDDSDYTAGYVASLKTGYVRFPALKEKGSSKGGRAVFVDPAAFDIDLLVNYLQNQAVVISDIGMYSITSATDYSKVQRRE